MIEPFIYTGLPARVVFGAGTVERVAEEIRRLDASRALVLTTAEQTAQGRYVAEIAGELAAGVYCGAVMHTPVNVTESALAVVREKRVDCLVAIGGGSTIGLAKAIALRTDLPQIAVPTTYAGSEMTPILGQTDAALKTTISDRKVLPETVIYDVELTLTLPAVMSGTSGINAIAHAVEALYARNGNPILSMMAEKGVAALFRSLSEIKSDPANLGARSEALFGAWLCAVCLGAGGVALHHKLCHVLGGSFGLPHAETHTIVLPHALAHNAPAVPAAMEVLARAIGVEASGVCAALYDLAARIDAPTALRDIGMARTAIDDAVSIAMKSPYWNPRPIEESGIRDLLLDAWSGRRPAE